MDSTPSNVTAGLLFSPSPENLEGPGPQVAGNSLPLGIQVPTQELLGPLR